MIPTTIALRAETTRPGPLHPHAMAAVRTLNVHHNLTSLCLKRSRRAWREASDPAKLWKLTSCEHVVAKHESPRAPAKKIAGGSSSSGWTSKPQRQAGLPRCPARPPARLRSVSQIAEHESRRERIGKVELPANSPPDLPCSLLFSKKKAAPKCGLGDFIRRRRVRRAASSRLTAGVRSRNAAHTIEIRLQFAFGEAGEKFRGRRPVVFDDRIDKFTLAHGALLIAELRTRFPCVRCPGPRNVVARRFHRVHPPVHSRLGFQMQATPSYRTACRKNFSCTNAHRKSAKISVICGFFGGPISGAASLANGPDGQRPLKERIPA